MGKVLRVNEWKAEEWKNSSLIWKHDDNENEPVEEF